MAGSTLDLIHTALITGGGGGIGKAMAEYLISKNKKVIIVGRTESKLQQTTRDIGAAAYYVLDTGDTQQIADIVPRILKDHPDLNCLMNNAGVQRPFEFPGSNFTNGDYSFDLEKADQEIDINIRGPMHLTVALLPHFTNLDDERSGVIINVSSVLGFMPSSVINPVYNGTKAWVHFFTTNMRTQLAKNGAKIKIVEIVPPTVATDLHRERTDPNDNKKENNKAALGIEEFIEEIAKGLENGDDTISAGTGKALVQTWNDTMGKKYQEAVSKLK